MKYVFSTARPKRYRFPTHVNDLVMDRSHAAASEVFIVELSPDEAPPLHQHPEMEQIFYILTGSGRLEIGSESQTYPVNPGDVVRIPLDTLHSIRCDGDETLRYLAVDCFPGGRPVTEPTWDVHVENVCRGLGWDFNQIAPDAS